MKLRKVKIVKLVPKTPFHFDATVYKPDHFPSADNDWQPGIRWQTMFWQGRKLGLKLENRGTTKKPKILLHVWSKSDLSKNFIRSLKEEIKYRLCLDVDLSEFTRKFKNNPFLGPIIKKWQGMRPLNYSSLYEYLMIGLVLQNCTVKRSISMMQTLLENYGTLLEYDAKKLYCHWQPEDLKDVSEEKLRNLKIGYRAKSVKRITDAFLNGTLKEIELRGRTKEEQREVLLNLYGVGPATVWYILFDVFHYFDELNHISPWEQKIYSKLFFDKDPEKPASIERLLKHFERYGKYRMLAIHYIWEDLWWKRKNENIPWLEKLIRI